MEVKEQTKKMKEMINGYKLTYLISQRITLEYLIY